MIPPSASRARSSSHFKNSSGLSFAKQKQQERRAIVAGILRKMESKSNPANVLGMARFGIKSRKVYGLTIPQLKKLAREVGRTHLTARLLWATGIH